MDRKRFTSLLSKRLYPVLRAEGFRGAGTTLRRVGETSIDVFNVQAGSGGNRCYLNLGVHFSFLPAEGGQLVEPSELKESHCAFRARIDPPSDQQFGWSYGSSEGDTEANVGRVIQEWERQAKPFFERHSYPNGVIRLLEELSPASVHPKHLLTFARIALHLTQKERAKQLGQLALERVPSTASGLKYDLTQFLLRAA